MEALSYTRPEEKSGLDAMKLLTEWTLGTIRLDSDGKGFWLIYELLNGSLNFKLLVDDSPYALGALLLRLTTNHDHDLLPLLRLMETERELAVDMPKYEDGRSKTMKFFKGRTGKGMPEKMYDKLLSRLPRLRCSHRKAADAAAAVRAADHRCRCRPCASSGRHHRSWLAPRTLDNALKERALPAPFNQQLDGGEALVLAPINPRSFVRRRAIGAAGDGGGGGGGGGEKLGVEQHPAAASVVARKMQKRARRRQGVADGEQRDDPAAAGLRRRRQRRGAVDVAELAARSDGARRRVGARGARRATTPSSTRRCRACWRRRPRAAPPSPRRARARALAHRTPAPSRRVSLPSCSPSC